jgi:hypothetical protein
MTNLATLHFAWTMSSCQDWVPVLTNACQMNPLLHTLPFLVSWFFFPPPARVFAFTLPRWSLMNCLHAFWY